MERRTFTRQQMYRLVWQKPVRAVAADIGISDVALAKACRRLAIPLPGRGFWAKIDAGRRLNPIPLPTRAGMRTEVTFAPARRKAERSDEVRSRALEERLSIPALSDLSAPHPVTKSLRSALRKQKPTSFDRGLIRAQFASVAVSVSPQTTERALRLLDTLLRELKSRGLTIVQRQKEHSQRETEHEALLEGEPVQLRVRESYRQTRRTEHELAALRKRGEYPTSFSYTPTSVLNISLDNAPYGSRRAWKDTKGAAVENQLTEILAATLALPEILREKRRIAAEEQYRYREAEIARLEEQRHRQAEERSIADLVKEAADFQSYRQVDAYLTEVQQRAAERGPLPRDFVEALKQLRYLAQRLDRRNDRIAILSRGKPSEPDALSWRGISN